MLRPKGGNENIGVNDNLIYAHDGIVYDTNPIVNPEVSYFGS
jgi:hypothetical protein